MGKTVTAKKDIEIKNPFPGLRPFTFEESHLYFGRGKQSKAVSRLLQDNQFAAVIGASGSGKSSLAYCGVVPEFFKDSGDSGKVISFRPGDDPIKNMVDAFIKVFPGKIGGVDSVDLITNGKSLVNWISEYEFKFLSFLLVIDQFEELFRYSRASDNEEAANKAARFVEMIVNAVRSGDSKIQVMVTMRSDFIGECSAYQNLTDLINKSNYLIPQMTRDDYREAIDGPLKLNKIGIEESLVEQLLDDVGQDSDQLPVLQHAMMRAFNYWKSQGKSGKALSIGDYESVGTMDKALSDHANEAYDELTEGEKLICERLFKTITEKSGDNRGVRRPTTIRKIAEIAQCEPDEVIKVANTFRSMGRTFLTPYQPVKLTAATIIDVSHESLMRIWDKLRLWVDEEASSVQMYKRLIDASALYQAGRTGLWRPPDLQLALNWKDKQKPTLEWAVQYFPAFERSMLYLNTSDSEFRKEEENKIKLQKRRLRVTRTFALILGSIAVVAMGLFLWTRDLQRQTEIARDNAIEQQRIAELRRIEADSSAAEALRQQRIATQQTTIAEEQTVIATEKSVEAEDNLRLAERQANIARDNYRTAQENQRRAEENEREAMSQKEQAEIAREEAYQRRLVSIAKSIAVKLLQVDDDPDLQALLAFQAYKYNTDNKGNRYDADIYGGLYEALKSNISSGYNVYSGHNSSVRAIAWYKSRNGFLSAGSDGKIMFMSGDFRNSRSNSLIANTNQVNEALAVSPDESVFACGTDGGGIFVYDIADPDVFFKLQEAHNGNVRELAFEGSGQKLISTGLDNTVMEWDMSTKRGTVFANLSSRPTCLAVSNFTRQLLVGTRDGKLFEYSLDRPGSGRLIYNVSGNPVLSVSYTPDDRAIVVGTLSGMVRIIDRNNTASGINLRGPEARVMDVAFSYNGKFLAAATYDGNVYLWETSDWNLEPVVMSDNEGYVLTICFSEDSRYFYSGSTKFPTLIGRPTESSLMIGNFCNLVDRNLTQVEWSNYIGEDIPYEETCPGK